MGPNEIAALLAPPGIEGLGVALCVQPHPDDNEIGMGGSVAKLVESGCHVIYLTVTDGCLGNKDANATQQETAAARRKEAERAAKRLGVSECLFLDRPDGSLDDPHALAGVFAAILRSTGADAVFGPDPFLPYECHLDHVVTGRAVCHAFMMVQDCSALGLYFTASPNTAVDVTAHWEDKFEAIACHESQMPPGMAEILRTYLSMRSELLADGRTGFFEGLRMMSHLQAHCFDPTGLGGNR